MSWNIQNNASSICLTNASIRGSAFGHSKQDKTGNGYGGLPCICVPAPCAVVVTSSADMLRLHGLARVVLGFGRTGDPKLVPLQGRTFDSRGARFQAPAPSKNDLDGHEKWTPLKSKVGPREGPGFGPLV